MRSVAYADGREVAVGKIVCVGLNYAAHVAEMGSAPASEPVLFLKPSTSLLREPGPIVLPAWSGEVHHEVELAILLGREACCIEPDEAAEVVAGYLLALDLTARDLQRRAKEKGRPWAVAKGFDGACPVSEVLPFTSFEDLADLTLRLETGGEVRQEGSTSRMLRPIPDLLAAASRCFTLEAGDLLLTGTPEGVGPLEAGDTVRASLGDRVTLEMAVVRG